MNYLACDLGAESGRLMLGCMQAGRVTLEEVHRFPNAPLRSEGSLCWNINGLWNELKNGLSKAAALQIPIASISADSWGLDYVLLDEHQKIIEPTFHYRDGRTAHGVDKLKERIDRATLFAETGIQFMPINTAYQLAAEAPERLKRARKLLMIGDAFNWLLSRTARSEESLASTSAIYNPRTRTWSAKVIKALEISPALFANIVPAGTRLGDYERMEVIATCSHDTGAAVAAVPAAGVRPWAYISSGTWSLMGVEVRQAVLTDLCRELNFTNEIGYGGTVRLLKNIVGLWIVQECRRYWAQEGREYDYGTLTKMAGEAAAFGPLINPADARFLAPGNMPERIGRYCVETGQMPPDGVGETVRCALESLALQYRKTLGEAERLAGMRVEQLHVVGGGSQNGLLNQFTADATGIPVLAGPIEATAIGNVLVQAITAGELDSLAAARDLVGRSFELTTFEPREKERWSMAAEKFSKLK